VTGQVLTLVIWIFAIQNHAASQPEKEKIAIAIILGGVILHSTQVKYAGEQDYCEENGRGFDEYIFIHKKNGARTSVCSLKLRTKVRIPVYK
jgi:hypothetical protein